MKVEVKLSEPLPRVVEFVRQSGEVVEVQVDYPWVPPTCAHCNELGHISRNCLLLPAPPLGAAFPSSKVLKKAAPKAVSKDKVYVPVATLPVVPAGTLPSPSSSAPPLPCPPPPPVAPVTAAPPLHHLDPSPSKNPPPLPSSPLISDSSPPLTFTSPGDFLFPISPPATTEKQSLQRSKSIPSLHSFPSFMSQLAYFSSLPPLTSNTLPTKENCPIKNTSPDPPSIPISNPFDHLATESALHSEEPQNL
ncbi:vegetative cell wall protein gp1-like [Brassica napus]|uniref:vegetative cell wall protein gp1-like n=1 Tax=Brassica napus TaxID=3708 RepID=UPI0006AB4B01|nr:vegetative cell wall protein gp1-like [Brassica napus]